jgi:hypothetical protein
MVNWNSVRKSFVLRVLVALLAACSSPAVETTPIADAQPARVAPTPTATTVPAAAPSSIARYGLCGGAAVIVLILLAITRRRPATRRE